MGGELLPNGWRLTCGRLAASLKRLLGRALVAAQSDSRDTKRQTITLGQNVRKARRPGPMGFGLGSGHSPIAAATTMTISGPQPRMKRPRPTRTQPDCRYSRM